MVYDSMAEIQKEHESLINDPALWASEVVVTHHYPTDESIAPRWQGEPSNVFFSARIDKTLQKHPNSNIKLWIHGHTHDPMDFVSKYGFRVYCNPHGYPGEGSNRNFWDRLLVEVP
jgi:Icc-related predicted phosphoesterase